MADSLQPNGTGPAWRQSQTEAAAKRTCLDTSAARESCKSLLNVGVEGSVIARESCKNLLNVGVGGTVVAAESCKNLMNVGAGGGTLVKKHLARGAEEAISAVSAASSTLHKSLGTEALHDAESTKPLLAYDDIQICREPFHEMRYQALYLPSRARDTLMPYASLHLDVSSARSLFARQVSSKSIERERDPYVQVFVNDEWQASSAWRYWSNSPTWDFVVSLEIWSPLSIVQIRVVHRGTFGSSSLIGFVEFCVADLEPNDLVSGWFELRCPAKLENTAPWRLRRHERTRDDHFGSDESPDAEGDASPSAEDNLLPSQVSGGMLARSASEKSLGTIASSEGRSNFKERRSYKSRFFAFGCRGPPPKENTRENDVTMEPHCHAGDIHTNAGEVHVALRLCAPDHQSHSDLEAQEQDWPDQVNDEWFAFCFDMPVFSQPHTTSYRACFKTLHQDILDIYYLIRDGLFGRVGAVIKYLARWKYWPLTAALFFWWWFLCLWTLHMLFTVPLWFVLLLHLLRQDKWFRAMVVTPKTAPLNDEGLIAMQSRRESASLACWLDRLIASMHGSVNYGHEGDLTILAAALCKDNSASIRFSKLLEILSNQKWITWHAVAATCPKGHHLKYLGTTSHQKWQSPPPGHAWKCQRYGGCPNHVRKGNCFKFGRFSCELCDFDLCEICAYNSSDLPALFKFPIFVYPQWLLEWLEDAEHTVEMLHHALAATFHHATLPFYVSPRGNAAAKKVYLSLVLSSTVLVPLPWVRGYRVVLSWTFCIVFALIGTFALMYQTLKAQMIVRAIRASARQHTYVQKRRTGGCAAHWAFFTPDAEIKPVES